MDQIQKKLFSNKFKKPCFWPILGPFSQFLGQRKISWKIWLCHAQLHYGFLAPYQNLERVNDAIQRKRLDRWKDRRMDRPYFIGPFQLLLGVQKAFHLSFSIRKNQLNNQLLKLANKVQNVFQEFIATY